MSISSVCRSSRTSWVSTPGRACSARRSPARVDILFLDDPIDDLWVCVTPALDFDIFASGRHIARGGSSAEIFFAVSQRVFALASDRRARDALEDAFGLWEPRC